MDAAAAAYDGQRLVFTHGGEWIGERDIGVLLTRPRCTPSGLTITYVRSVSKRPAKTCTAPERCAAATHRGKRRHASAGDRGEL